MIDRRDGSQFEFPIFAGNRVTDLLVKERCGLELCLPPGTRTRLQSPASFGPNETGFDPDSEDYWDDEEDVEDEEDDEDEDFDEDEDYEDDIDDEEDEDEDKWTEDKDDEDEDVDDFDEEDDD